MPETSSTNVTTIIVLMLAAGAALAMPILRARQLGYGLVQYLVYLFGFVMARVLWRAEVVGTLPVDRQQGAVIICNHRGPFDPAFIQLAADRVVHWMVAREYCTHPLLAWMFRSVGAIPVNRGGIDTAATKLAIRHAQAGELVGMLPEGRINLTEQLLLPGRPGAALVALKARVPVIPCYISGSPMAKTVYGSLFKPARARLIIGAPVDVSEYYGREREPGVLEEVTKQLLSAIAELAGQPEFEPALAGRQWKPAD